MILITGAAGKTGQAVVATLRARGAPVRAFVRRPEQETILLAIGAAEVVVGDLQDQTAIQQAMRGMESVYHIPPNMHPDEVGIGQGVLAAAKSAGVEHFVYHSVMHPQTEAMPHHWNKLRVEELVFESGLSYTILQPTAYMQNILAYWDAITRYGIYALPYSPETQTCLVDLEDVAEAAAIVLTQPGHQGATYELAGTEAVSPADVAELLSSLLVKRVTAQAIPLDEWQQSAREAQLDVYKIATLMQMFTYYEKYGFRGNANVLSWLLQRPPTTIGEFLTHRVKIKNV